MLSRSAKWRLASRARVLYISRPYRMFTIVTNPVKNTETKSITKDVDPIQTINNKDGVTEVYVVRRLKSGEYVSKDKLANHPLSARLKDVHDAGNWTSISPKAQYKPVEPPTKVQVSSLSHGLDKVLFNPGVHYLKDPRTKKFNFTPYLEKITQPLDFDYDALQPYITSSKDTGLVDLAKNMGKRYIGSTSSMSASLSHFYFVMSRFKPVNTSCLSKAFKNESKKFTRGSKVAASIYLRWKDGVYAIDADKSHDPDETVLSIMGKSLEKVLTLEPDKFERYLKQNSSQITEEEKKRPESYAYGEQGKFLLRSQLDCYDSRLKRGTFDLKTRAAVAVRLDVHNYKEYLGYTLKKDEGLFESFEREYYDMMRSAFLKYNFQVRIGHMDGIMVSYHNTRKIFGFQYISREEMDSRLFGSSIIGDKVFRNSLVMFEAVLDKATEKYPEQTLRISFDTKQENSGKTFTYIYVEAAPSELEKENGAVELQKNKEDMEALPQSDDNHQKIPSSVLTPYDDLSVYRLETQSHVSGRLVEGPLEFKKEAKEKWTLRFKVNEILQDQPDKMRSKFIAMRRKQAEVNSPSPRANPMLNQFKRMSQQSLDQEKQDSMQASN